MRRGMLIMRFFSYANAAGEQLDAAIEQCFYLDVAALDILPRSNNGATYY